MSRIVNWLTETTHARIQIKYWHIYTLTNYTKLKTLFNRLLRHPLRKRIWPLYRHGLENLVVTGKVEGRRTSGRQRLKYLDSLSRPTCWKDNVSPTQIIRASEDGELWYHMAANVVCDGTALQWQQQQQQQQQRQRFCL